MIRCASSHGPRSTPVRTSARGAGTRQAPCRHASHISSQEASNATDSPASTRSPGPIGSSARNRRASASTNAAAEPWLTATPFGVPVEPDVKMIHASSPGPGVPGVPIGAPCVVRDPLSPSTAHTPASPKTSSARSSGSSASTGTYAAPAERTARIATYSSAVPDEIRTPTRSPTPMPPVGEAPPDDVDLLGQPAVAEHRAAGVDRGLVGVLRHRLGEHVEQRAAGRRRCGGIDGGGVGESECHRAPAGVGAVRAQRRQRAARGRMSHLPGERAVSSAGSRLGAGLVGTTRGTANSLRPKVNGRCQARSRRRAGVHRDNITLISRGSPGRRERCRCAPVCRGRARAVRRRAAGGSV